MTSPGALLSPFRSDCLKGKVALVTGGGSGIGYEISRQIGELLKISLQTYSQPFSQSAGGSCVRVGLLYLHFTALDWYAVVATCALNNTGVKRDDEREPSSYKHTLSTQIEKVLSRDPKQTDRLSGGPCSWKSPLKVLRLEYKYVSSDQLTRWYNPQ